MPCHNAASTLAEALQSLLQQTYADFEVILVDDGSTDSSAEVAANVAATDARVSLVASSHVGIVEALRIAAARVRGSVIARMDADDIAEPTRLETQIDYLEKNPDIGLCGPLVSHFGEKARIGRVRDPDWDNALHVPDAIERERFVECPIPHPTFMMRRDPFDAAGGYVDRGWAEDHDLLLRVHRAGWRLGKVAEPLLRWRHTASRLSMTNDRYAPEQFRALKRHHLVETVLDGRHRFFQWGAGEVGKPWLREWGKHAPTAVVDINPRKFGKRIHGVPVIPPDELPAPGEVIVLVAVGAPGAREEIRDWFAPRGYDEGRDYLFIA